MYITPRVASTGRTHICRPNLRIIRKWKRRFTRSSLTTSILKNVCFQLRRRNFQWGSGRRWPQSGLNRWNRSSAGLTLGFIGSRNAIESPFFEWHFHSIKRYLRTHIARPTYMWQWHLYSGGNPGVCNGYDGVDWHVHNFSSSQGRHCSRVAKSLYHFRTNRKQSLPKYFWRSNRVKLLYLEM